jgi:hypothetical protein
MLVDLIKGVFYILTAIYLTCLYSKVGRISDDISTIKTILINETYVKKAEKQDSITEEQVKTFALHQMKVLEIMTQQKNESVNPQKFNASNFIIKQEEKR